MSSIDAELVQLIGLIYDAVLDQDRWYDALDRLRAHFRIHNVMMALSDLRGRPGSLSYLLNIPDHWAAAMSKPEYNAALVDIFGGREALEGFPLEEPITTLSVIDRPTLEANKYYTDLAGPEGMIDCAAIFFSRDRFSIGNIGLGRHRDHGPITEGELAGLRVIAPHLRRAVLISGLLEHQRSQRALFEAVVDSVGSSVVIVDERAEIIHANAAARDVIQDGDPLLDRLGRLEIKGEVIPGALRAAVFAAAAGDIPLGRKGIAIPGRRPSGDPYIVHVMPLRNRTNRRGVPGEATAAVFLAERGDDPKHVVDAATILFELTPAEARIFELTVEGRSSAEITKILSISSNTLKSHTRHLLEKMGQRRRSDLFRLATRLSAPAGT